uniref:Uncharacterized protein n=1 Tax=Cupriavidus taiwanensis TaxID=164546 RepID=A0A375H9X6_9BURK|nr:protein of unknown function [Cupriavidus taiwanensis]
MPVLDLFRTKSSRSWGPYTWVAAAPFRAVLKQHRLAVPYGAAAQHLRATGRIAPSNHEFVL